MELESIIAITGALSFLVGIFIGIISMTIQNKENMQKTVRYYRELNDSDKLLYDTLLKQLYDIEILLFKFTPTKPFRYAQNWINNLIRKLEHKFVDE